MLKARLLASAFRAWVGVSKSVSAAGGWCGVACGGDAAAGYKPLARVRRHRSSDVSMVTGGLQGALKPEGVVHARMKFVLVGNGSGVGFGLGADLPPCEGRVDMDLSGNAVGGGARHVLY